MKQVIQLFDENNRNIENHLCAFIVNVTTEHHRLDGVYGVSGSEMTEDGKYYKTIEYKALGYYNSPTGQIKDLRGFTKVCRKAPCFNYGDIRQGFKKYRLYYMSL